MALSKNLTEDAELQTLALSPADTCEDDRVPFVLPDDVKKCFPPISSVGEKQVLSFALHEKKHVERSASGPGQNSKSHHGLHRKNSHEISSPSVKISYSNEHKLDLGRFVRDRSILSGTRPTGTKKEAWRIAAPQKPSAGSSLVSHGVGNRRKPVPLALLPPRMPICQLVDIGGVQPLLFPPRMLDRSIAHHSFETDAADVRQIEEGLLQLMDDFQAGSLRALGKESRLRQMEAIREKQEKLARIHFDMGAEQDLYSPLSEDGLRISHSNMHLLMDQLAQLSESIEHLHTNTSEDRKSSTGHTDDLSNNCYAARNGMMLHADRPTEHFTNHKTRNKNHSSTNNKQGDKNKCSSSPDKGVNVLLDNL